MSKTYILDGNSLLFRCFYATFRPGVPVMSAPDGTPTNAIFGFVSMIKNITKGLKSGDRIAVCFDTGKPTFRSKEIEAYKAQRKPIDPSLKAQIPLAHTLLDAMGIDHCEMEGYEGDDVAGSMAKYAEKQGDKVALFTSDRDFLQLIDDNIEVHALRKGLSDVIVFNKENMVALYGCRADQVVDFKAIAGDSSDNYKGIPHIGEKTALNLLKQYDHLEDILKAYDGKCDSALARNLNAGAEEGRLCRKIATIVTDLDVKDYYDAALLKPADDKKLLAFYEKYGMQKYARPLREKIAKAKAPVQMSLFDAEDTVTSETNTKKPVFTFIEDIEEKPQSVSIILNGNNENVSPILGYVLTYKDHSVKILLTEKVKSAARFKEWLNSSIEKKDSLDSKSLIVASRRLGLEPNGIAFDFLLASYILDSDHAATLEDVFANADIALPEDPIESAVVSAEHMDKTRDHLLSLLKEQKSENLFEKVEIPLARNLADMETEGMPLNLGELSKIGENYKNFLADLEKKIYELAGGEFNIKSPKQVSDLLFTKLGLVRAKGETGTSVEVLANHYNDHPIVPLILQHRTFSKIVSGYIDALPKHVLVDNKIHAKINQTLTSTGRLSCSEPNLQNISIRKEEGKEIRKAFFYPEDDYEFLSLDYSQVELRVLASIANIKNLIEVCNSGEDIHKATASKVYGVPLDQVTSEMRRKAKTVNFGIVYGISAFGLKKRLDISFQEAHEIIDAFKKTFEGIDEFEKKTIEFARQNGYVQTILNRRRYFPDINSTDKAKRSFSERAAVNAVIQGSAADLIKVAMNKVGDVLKGYKTKMIMQIHDELVFKVYKPEEKTLLPLITRTMDSALPLKVSLSVDGSFGHSWFDCK